MLSLLHLWQKEKKDLGFLFENVYADELRDFRGTGILILLWNDSSKQEYWR
jgi:hypothetical protein